MIAFTGAEEQNWKDYGTTTETGNYDCRLVLIKK